MFNQLELYAKLGIAVLLVIALSTGIWYVHHQGYNSGVGDTTAQWNAEKVATQKAELAAVAQRTKDNAAQAAAQAETNQLLQKGYSNEIANDNAVHIAALNSVRNSAATGAGNRPASTAEATSASSSDATAPGTRLLSDAGVQDIFALLQRADEVTAQGRACQDFVKDNGLAIEVDK